MNRRPPRTRGPQTSPAGPGIAGERGPHPAPPPAPRVAGQAHDPARLPTPRAVERVLQRRADLRADAVGFLLAVVAFLGVIALLTTAVAWIGGLL